jgi:putative FmdB family regulatory protein
MPRYDFECASCGFIFEQHATIHQRYKPCPICDSKATRVILAAPAAHYRDPGFTLHTVDIDRTRESMLRDGTLREPDAATVKAAKEARV